MRAKIATVGLGQLGSNLIPELTKRAVALGPDIELSLVLIDDDQVEDRNTVAQWFSPRHVGQYKCEAVRDEVAQYGFPVQAYVDRFELGSQLLEGANLIVDAVDNAPTRHDLWKYAVATGIPLISLGNGMAGNGRVNWTWRGYDTNPYGFTARSATDVLADLTREEPPKIPPCELTGFRALALNTTLAALEAIFLFYGRDVRKRFPEEVMAPGWLTDWVITSDGYSMIGKDYIPPEEGTQQPQ